MNRPCIVAVEDDRRYRHLLELIFTRRNYQVILTPDGRAGIKAVTEHTPDLVLLDLALPDNDGFVVLERLRAASDAPVVIVSARAQQAQIVRGLLLGAADYVIKPFSADELLARIEAILRRFGRAASVRQAAVEIGDLAIDFTQRQVWQWGRRVGLTPTEYQLLAYLARNAECVLETAEILRGVWGAGYEGEVTLLYTAVARLRRKLGDDPRRPRYIQVRRGVGYLLRRDDASAAPAGAAGPPRQALAS
ncbi:MAG: response regulator transcription factor [Chloroflexi bacterium]|nr:response regulator transcription factor [Chloroflexota bacterium]